MPERVLNGHAFAGDQRGGLIPHLEQVCGLRVERSASLNMSRAWSASACSRLGSLTRASASCSMTSNAAVTVGSAAP